MKLGTGGGKGAKQNERQQATGSPPSLSENKGLELNLSIGHGSSKNETVSEIRVEEKYAFIHHSG